MRKEFILIIIFLFVAGCTNIQNPFNQQQKVVLGKGIGLTILNAPEEIFPDEEFSLNLGLINYLDNSISGEIRIVDDYYIIDKIESFFIDAAILDKKIIPAKIPEEGEDGIEINGLIYTSDVINQKGIRNKDKIGLNILLDYDVYIDAEGSLDTASKGYTLSGSSFGVIASTAPVEIERVVYSRERDITKLTIKFRNVGNGRITSRDNEINIKSVSSEGTEYKCNKNKIKVEEREESSITCNAALDEGKHQLRISYSFPYEIGLGIEVPIELRSKVYKAVKHLFFY